MSEPAADPTDAPIVGVAFLLAQLGAHATARYARRVADLGLTPAHTGVLRFVGLAPGPSQQALAGRLGVAPSRIVALVDDLERQGLVERRRGAADRRSYALYLTAAGEETLAAVRDAAVAHEGEVTAALPDAERRELVRLLRALAEAHGLLPGVHPGYRTLGPPA